MSPSIYFNQSGRHHIYSSLFRHQIIDILDLAGRNFIILLELENILRESFLRVSLAGND